MEYEEQPIVSLVSLGCPKNLVDSEKMLGSLAEAGCIVGAEPGEANVIIVNTCGFLAAARDESVGVLQEALSLKEAGQVRRVIVAGCLAQRDGEQLREILPGLDAIVGVNNRDEMVQAVLADDMFVAIDSYAHVRQQMGGPVLGDDRARLRLTPPHTAYLRISEGCGQGCSFCTIPSIRGPFRSKPVDRVLAEAVELVDDGAIELNLIGQDTTSYGPDIEYAEGLAGLMGRLNELDSLRWIRLLYSYPSLVTDEIIDAIAGLDKVVPYLDVPLQHVADGVLSRMRRRITTAETERLIEKLRDRIPGLTLRTTFIVGFPGETEEDFRQLLDFVQRHKFDAMGVFTYSAEPGTPAAKLDGAIDAETAEARAEQIMLAQQEIAFAANAERVGQTLDVLVDGVDYEGRCVGRHAGQAPDVDSLCYFTEVRPAGSIVSTTVADWSDYDLVVTPKAKPHIRKRKRRR